MKIIQRAIIALIISLVFQMGYSQSVGIGTTTPNANAILDLSDIAKGLLLPRMDSVHRKNIPNTQGLIVYDTTYKSVWYNDGNAWMPVAPKGNAIGDMLYWNGNQWAQIPVGTAGQFLSLQGNLIPAWGGSNLAALTTTAISGISGATANGGGNIIADGGSPITARGVVWSTSQNPTVALPTKTNDGTGIGNFSSILTGLAGSTTYYVRAYATNANGTNYGNQVSFSTSQGTFTIGQSYGGGYIFYIDGTGQHGLIVSATDVISNIIWGNSVATGATGAAIGTGSANTTLIVNNSGVAINAASSCKLYYNAGGFNDWYLPSLFEVTTLYNSRNSLPEIGLYYTTSSGNAYIWSSTEGSATSAWTIDFKEPTPLQYYSSKTFTLYNHVRAVRSF